MGSRRCRILGALFGLCGLAAAPALAENRLALRGTYFREASTRVVQPMIELRADLPAGYDIGGHAAVDAISSASIAQGAATDKVFTENRYEAGLSGGRTFDALGPMRLGAFARYSREPDYFSYSGGLTLSREVWERTGTIGFTLARTHDQIRPRPPLSPRTLDVWFVGLSYAQVVTPTTLLQGGYELFHLDGFYGNPYIAHPDLGREQLPEKRIRHALAFKVAQFLPRATLGAQLHYRFYFDQGAFGAVDPWGMTAHTVEGRLYKNLGPNFEVRLSYRYHWQGDAQFFCNSRPDMGGRIGCYGMQSQYHSWDPKFGRLTTHLPEVKLTWDLRSLGDVPFLRRLFAGGSVELSYGYYVESAYYGQPFTDKTAPPLIDSPLARKWGGAHIMQTGYALSF